MFFCINSNYSVYCTNFIKLFLKIIAWNVSNILWCFVVEDLDTDESLRVTIE